ncbi:hypothetical protein [Streptomyces sp. NPDC017448]|uniref:hypothetical protein n=1 Tax=Streptomyces sp. NPDC017448 TaxID=3364996 RepID=UPI00379084BF
MGAARADAPDRALERTGACEAECGSPVTSVVAACVTADGALGAVNEINSFRAQGR